MQVGSPWCRGAEEPPSRRAHLGVTALPCCPLHCSANLPSRTFKPTHPCPGDQGPERRRAGPGAPTRRQNRGLESPEPPGHLFCGGHGRGEGSGGVELSSCLLAAIRDGTVPRSHPRGLVSLRLGAASCQAPQGPCTRTLRCWSPLGKAATPISPGLVTLLPSCSLSCPGRDLRWPPSPAACRAALEPTSPLCSSETYFQGVFSWTGLLIFIAALTIFPA